MKLWIDDVRKPPGDDWLWAQTSEGALSGLELLSPFEEISFDHDLGGEDTTRPVVLWMCENDCWPPVIRVHTANPVGREWLVGMITRYGPGVTE